MRPLEALQNLMTGSRSAEVMARARELFPGGVNSPVRAFRGVGGEPVVAARGEGARIWDVDGKEYIDFVLSWGPLVLGHASPIVLDALERAMTNGTSFGMPTELEVQLGELIRARMPHIEMMRFVSSGSEEKGPADPAGQRPGGTHRARRDSEVRGVLSRSRGFVPGGRWVRRGDTRSAGFAGGAGGACLPDADRSVQ